VLGGDVVVPDAVDPVGGGKAGPPVFEEVAADELNASPWCFDHS
jgi:hypothetical protein